MVVILQPNFEKVGKMRLWLWEFVAWAGREWNLVQDVYWWSHDAMPLSGTNRKQGLLRQSVKMCVWLGPPTCFRNQDNVLWLPSDDIFAERKSDSAMRTSRSGRNYRNSTIAETAEDRGGSTPFTDPQVSNAMRCGCKTLKIKGYAHITRIALRSVVTYLRCTCLAG